MKVFTQSLLLSDFLQKRRKSKILGFVPTMGALHEGHLSLVKKAQEICDTVVVSIFINPTQFNDPNDFEKYPRDYEKDLNLLEQNNVDCCFLPETIEEIYPAGYVPLKIDVGEITKYMEGAHRSGHFDGVIAVVNRLFEIVTPHYAFFGLKDYQQYLVVNELAKQKHPEITIKGVDISREQNMLARSSRNERLNPAERKEAGLLYKSLQFAQKLFPNTPVPDIKEAVAKFLDGTNLKLEYFEISHAYTLVPLGSNDKTSAARAFIAAYIGDIRLIDNIALND